METEPTSRGQRKDDGDGARGEGRLSAGRAGEPTRGGLLPTLPATALATDCGGNVGIPKVVFAQVVEV